jgi:fucose permease
VPDYRRDAGFALLCGLALVAYLRQAGAFDTLWSASAIAVGVAGALSVEALFVLDTPAASLWERRGVRTGSAIALFVCAVGLAVFLGPVVAAAACWGLGTYFVILAVGLLYW